MSSDIPFFKIRITKKYLNLIAVTAQKMKVDLVTFTEEILNGKLHFLCSEYWGFQFQMILTRLAYF